MGLWISASLLGPERLSYGDSWITLVIAGFVLAVINFFLKPILIFLSLPAILITLGLFILVVNGVVVLLAAWIYGPLDVNGLLPAVVAGVVIGLVNYLVTTILEDKK